MNDLRGRTVLVTGAAGGIGREFVLSLLRARANVLATDVSDAGLERLVKTIESDGFGQCLTSRHLDIPTIAPVLRPSRPRASASAHCIFSLTMAHWGWARSAMII